MRTKWGFVFLCIGCVLFTCTTVDAGNGNGAKTVIVDCAKGDSINKALQQKADELVIEILGACQEDVVIERDDVTLRGIDPNATVVADTEQAIRIDRASRTTLEKLTVRGGKETGIYVYFSSGVTVSHVTAEDNRAGMTTYGSTVRIVDSTFSRNAGYGLYIANGSSLMIDGVELNVSDNGSDGLLVSESTVRSAWPASPKIVANDNGNIGIVLQGGTASVIWFGPIDAKRNYTGIASHGGVLGSDRGPVDISENEFGVTAAGQDAVAELCCASVKVSQNSEAGLYASFGGQISFEGYLVANGTAAHAHENARLNLWNTKCVENGEGVLVHGGTAYILNSTILGNTSIDVHLTFGSRVNFDGVNDVGSINCDDTVLVEGDVSCPTP